MWHTDIDEVPLTKWVPTNAVVRPCVSSSVCSHPQMSECKKQMGALWKWVIRRQQKMGPNKMPFWKWIGNEALLNRLAHHSRHFSLIDVPFRRARKLRQIDVLSWNNSNDRYRWTSGCPKSTPSFCGLWHCNAYLLLILPAVVNFDQKHAKEKPRIQRERYMEEFLGDGGAVCNSCVRHNRNYHTYCSLSWMALAAKIKSRWIGGDIAPLFKSFKRFEVRFGWEIRCHVHVFCFISK